MLKPGGRRWRWRVMGVSALTALTLVATAAVGLAPRAAAHRQTPSAQSKLPPVIYPTYYDGLKTQTVDRSVHPEDPPNTYRVDTHYSACQQFGGPSDPSQRVNLTDAELTADGLMPRNAFANIEDWDRSVLSATTRVCDTYQIFNADGTPAFVNGSHSQRTAPIAGPRLPGHVKDGQNGIDCNCTNLYWTTVPTVTGYAGWAADGTWTPVAPPPPGNRIGTQHVAQYAYSWIPSLTYPPDPSTGFPPNQASDSIWVGSSGLFTVNNNTEILQQTGIQNWAYCGTNCIQSMGLFWECIDPITHDPNCNGANIWHGTPSQPVNYGDEITMYISGNYHWNEDDAPGSGLTVSGNSGPVPQRLDSSDWITEDPVGNPYSPDNLYPFADFSNAGLAGMHWMDGFNNWRDAVDDTDLINYKMYHTNGSTPDLIAENGTTVPYYINAYWGYGLSVWWQAYH